MIRILHLIASSRGGGATHVRDLALGLDRMRFAAQVAMPEDGGNMGRDQFEAIGIPFHRVDIASGLSLQALWSVRSLACGADILHVHGVRALGHTPIIFYYDRYGAMRLQGGAVGRLPKSLHSTLNPIAAKIGRVWEAGMNRRLIASVKASQPDAIIILKGETITGETLDVLKSNQRPLVSWWVDDPFRVPQAVRLFHQFDVLYMFDKGRLSELEANGAKRIVYLPCACDHTTFRPMALNPSDYPALHCTIGFVAAFYPGRGALLSHMRGLDVGLWGPGWDAAPELQQLAPNTWRGRRIVAANAAKLYNLAKVCPNVHHPQTQIGGLNTRTFEVPAAGGFELVDHVAGLEENFEVGREIATYSSSAHFRELADYYLAHPDKRATISERGRARVLRDHTYEERLKTILGTMTV